MNKIQSIKAREILDSRGNPTVEVECKTESGSFFASVPSGASTGSKEAVELRDGGRRFGGKGVLKAVDNINKIIAPKLVNVECDDQNGIDDFLISLDNTENKSKLGANAIVGVSMAVCRAGAKAQNKELYKFIADLFDNEAPRIPRPAFNIINGGAHADNNIDFQEFMIAPKGETFSTSLRMASEIYYKLKEIIKEEYVGSSTNVGDEGGFAPQIETTEVAIALILKAINASNYEGNVDLILDLAASQFYHKDDSGEGYYSLNMGMFNSGEFLNYLSTLVRSYPIIGLEDPFAEDDWKGFSRATARLGDKISIIGDDLLVSNPKTIKDAKNMNACNAVILKINQIGTVTEILRSARLAKEYGWKTIVSHRSGDTCDSFIADLAVGISSDFIKSGAPNRGERLAKYNRLCRIEEELGK